MLDWIKIESSYYTDSRIRKLLEEIGFKGLGIYFALRIAIEAMNKDGIPLELAIALCKPYARKNRILQIINEFGLFSVSEYGIITVNPLDIPSRVHTHTYTPTYTPAYTPEHEPAHSSQENRIEKNIEEKKREEEKKVCFIKPTIDEINTYCRQRQNGIDAEYFFHFYESKGWMIGKNHMTDWQAAIRNWEHKNIDLYTNGI